MNSSLLDLVVGAIDGLVTTLPFLGQLLSAIQPHLILSLGLDAQDHFDAVLSSTAGLLLDTSWSRTLVKKSVDSVLL